MSEDVNPQPGDPTTSDDAMDWIDRKLVERATPPAPDAALIERLRNPNADRWAGRAADLIEAQAAEIERLAGLQAPPVDGWSDEFPSPWFPPQAKAPRAPVDEIAQRTVDDNPYRDLRDALRPGVQTPAAEPIVVGEASTREGEGDVPTVTDTAEDGSDTSPTITLEIRTDISDGEAVEHGPWFEQGATVTDLDSAYVVPARFVRFVSLDALTDQRERSWPDFHPELFCHRCGGRNLTSWAMVSDEWNRFRGHPDLPESEIICPQCATELHEEMVGQYVTWDVRPLALSAGVQSPPATPEPEPEVLTPAQKAGAPAKGEPGDIRAWIDAGKPQWWHENPPVPVPDPAQPPATPEPTTLVDQLRAIADDLDGPLECTKPAYGVPGHDHCAACCYGTGRVITCDEDQAMADAADALRRCAAVLARPVPVPDPEKETTDG